MNEQKDIIEQPVWSNDYACSLTEELQNRFLTLLMLPLNRFLLRNQSGGIVDQLSMQPPS
jgi:hypothetical protein